MLHIPGSIVGCFFVMSTLFYPFAVMFWKEAEDDLKKRGLKGSNDLFAMSFTLIFLTSTMLGLATGACITEAYQLQNTWREASIMVSSTLLSCLLFAVVHIRWRSRLIRKINPSL